MKLLFLFSIFFQIKTYGFSPKAIEEFPESTYIINKNSIIPVAIKRRDTSRSLASLEKYPVNYRDEISFWKDIYTKHPEENILIHDKKDLELVYSILNFSELKKNSKNLIVYEILKNRSIRKHVRNIKNQLKTCDSNCKKNLLDGKNYNSKELIKNMRTQTGQKDIIQGGLTRLEKVRPEISELFKTTKANSKWIALPFLESSFNEKAISKVNAAGAWQIMPWIGKRLLPYSKGNIDARFNIYLSTLAAIQILKQNIRITKSDEISIIAYNSGLRNYFKTKKKLKKEYIDYIEYLENADSKIFGFASRNFLMEYFALQESINPEKIIKNTKKSRVKFYISRCKTRPKKVIKLISANDPLANKRNNHYIKKSKVYPPGQIYITEINLPNKYYRKVKNTEIKRRAPIEWVKNTTLKPCSII